MAHQHMAVLMYEIQFGWTHSGSTLRIGSLTALRSQTSNADSVPGLSAPRFVLSGPPSFAFDWLPACPAPFVGLPVGACAVSSSSNS